MCGVNSSKKTPVSWNPPRGLAQAPFICDMIRRYRWHILFWAVYFAGWTWFGARTYGYPFRTALLVTAAYAVGQGGLIYMTVYRWMPRYLLPRRTARFIAWTAAGLSGATAFIAVAVVAVAGKRQGFTFWPLAGYIGLGNLYWLALAIVAATIRDRYRQERERSRTELRFLKSQLNPHFLFNALNSIYVLIRKDPDLAEHTLAGFSDMLRYQLYECATDHIAVDREVAYLENFMRLEQLRRGDGLAVDYEKPRGLGGFSIAPLLVFPLVENAFKYAADRVSIRLDYEASVFTAEISNTTDERPSGSVGGVGLDNLRKRLALLYPDRHRLEITAAPGEYSATLQLDVA